MSYTNRTIDPRFFYQKPKPKFGEILNANIVIDRDINKDLLVSSTKISEVRMLSKQYPFQRPQRFGYPPQRIQKY